MNLVTERLVLREFVPEDWPAVLAYQSDVRYLRFNPWSAGTLAEEGALEADMGYELAPRFWGQGYATEATQALAAFAFASSAPARS